MSYGSAILGERNLNMPQFTRTPSQYGMKARVKKRHMTRDEKVRQSFIGSGVAMTGK